MAKRNPEDGKEISNITRVILNDLKGRREIQINPKERRRIQRTEQKEETDHTQWMPKEIPQEMKQAIKKTEIRKKQPVKPTKKISVRKKQDKFDYAIQLKSGKVIKSKKVAIRGNNVILVTEEIKIEIPASSIKWIRETRIRLLTLE